MTKAEFMYAYRVLVQTSYKWASDKPPQLEGLMCSVATTLNTQKTTWVWDAPMSKQAWKECGGKDAMTLKALRALPN